MVSCDEDIRATPFIGDDADHILDLFNRRITGAEDGAFQMTGLIDGIVVDVNHIHALDERLPVGTLHTNDILVLDGYTGFICCLQELVAIVGLRGLSVRQNCQSIRFASLKHLPA